MKRKNVFLLVTLVLALALVFTACGGGGGSSGALPQTAVYTSTDGSGNTYRLTITENLSRSYAGAAGDTYELVINPGNKISTGTVQSVAGNVFTLKPDATTVTFTVTIAGSSMINITGTITITVGGGTVTGPGNIISQDITAGDGSLGKSFTITYNGVVDAAPGTTYTFTHIPKQIDPGFLTFAELFTNPGQIEVKVENGNLTLKLGEVKSELLTADFPDGSFEELGLVSNSAAIKVFSFMSIWNGVSETSSNRITYWKDISNNVAYLVVFLYANRDAIVSGTYINEYGAPVTLNLNLKEGWNTLLVENTFSPTNTNIAVSQVITTGKPDSDFMWVLD